VGQDAHGLADISYLPPTLPHSTVQRAILIYPMCLGGPAMIADEIWQQMYALAYFLHPDSGVARSVTLEAAERLVLLQRVQERPPGSAWGRLPAACWPQWCVYLASDGQERAHERPHPGRRLEKRPTPDDYLVRYLKCLVWRTMTESPCHVALALGCFLYRYPPRAIAQLAPVLCAGQDILRIRVRLASQLQARFPHAQLFATDHDQPRTRLATMHDRQVVEAALTMFTPWGTAHVPPPALGHAMRDTHSEGAPARAEWDRIHALLDPVGGGLPRLIREYNQPFPLGSPWCLADPDDMLAIPCFAR
jgi:hypothetical protein